MKKLLKNKRVREKSAKTIKNHNEVHIVDRELREQYGEDYLDLSRESIYRRIAKRTGYSTRTISQILNHSQLIILEG